MGWRKQKTTLFGYYSLKIVNWEEIKTADVREKYKSAVVCREIKNSRFLGRNTKQLLSGGNEKSIVVWTEIENLQVMSLLKNLIDFLLVKFRF